LLTLDTRTDIATQHHHPPVEASVMARLSVNLNKVALLRNSRRTGVPDLQEFAQIALEEGAEGITVHPRPDERHVRRQDVVALSTLMQPKRPRFELNVEGYPDERLLQIASEVRPEQCTLVPDAPGAFTSEKGWNLTEEELRHVLPSIAFLKGWGCRVILFVDPDPTVPDRVRETGADGIEIYTGAYAAAFRANQYVNVLDACAETARSAQANGLIVNAGHDLNLLNLLPLLARIPFLAEASIGHELTADALRDGFRPTVRCYAVALAGAGNGGISATSTAGLPQ
jgi:pyridoxine 5-phosphate synthase